MTGASKVLVIGGGVVGSACAYYLALTEADVTLVERTGIAAEASGASHGLIDWAQGLSRGTLDFVYESVQLLRGAAGDLDDFELTLDGYLMVAMDGEEISDLRRRYDKAREADLTVEWLEGPAIGKFEPALSNDVVAALYMPDSGYVDPRRMTLAFARAAERRGAQVILGAEITRLDTAGGRVVGAAAAHQVFAADHVILAAGAWSSRLVAPLGLSLPVEAGKGQMLSTQPLPRMTTRVINSSGAGVRQDRRGVAFIGSTLEFVGFDKTASETIAANLLLDAMRMVPALRQARVDKTWAGLRPMTPDHLPIVCGAPGVSGLWLATGHSRTGLSYAAGTGKALADLITRGGTSLPIGHFDLTRFADC